MIATQKPPELSRQLVLESMSDVKPRRVDWLWPRRFPCGMLSLIAGGAGLGKSTLSTDIAARVSRGGAWPDGSGNAKLGSVVMVSGEDGIDTTVQPRCAAAGADLNRIMNLRIHDLGTDGWFDLERDLRGLEDAVLERGDVRLIILDPLLSFIGNINPNKQEQVRRLLLPLSKLAENTGAAVISIMHPRKSEADSPLSLISGSGAFAQVPRAAWMVGNDPDVANARLLVVGKTNVNRPAAALRYRVVDASTDDETGRIEWLGASERTADEVFAPPSTRTNMVAPKAQEAEKFLRDVLSDGPRLSYEVIELAQDAGITDRTLARARKSLHVASITQGAGEQKRWLMALPECVKGRTPFVPDGCTP